MPILAICRGTQALNVVRGGTLVQHLPDSRAGGRSGRVPHRQRTPGSEPSHRGRDRSRQPARGDDRHRPRPTSTPSTTRRSIGSAATSSPSAWAEDGTIEAVEDRGRRLPDRRPVARRAADRPPGRAGAVRRVRGCRRGWFRGAFTGEDDEMKDLVERVGPAWSVWAGGHALGAYTLGVEEEAMLLDPRTWALAHRIDELLPRLPVGDAEQGLGRDARLRVRGADRGRGRRSPTRSPRSARCARAARAHARDARAAGGGLRHPPVRDLAGDRGLRRRALPVRLRLDARARPPRADVRAPRPRRRSRCRRPRSASTTGCASTCRSCSRCRPTRRSGRAATPGSRRRARRCFRPSRASACRAPSATTRPTSRPSTC